MESIRHNACIGALGPLKTLLLVVWFWRPFPSNGFRDIDTSKWYGNFDCCLGGRNKKLIFKSRWDIPSQDYLPFPFPYGHGSWYCELTRPDTRPEKRLHSLSRFLNIVCDRTWIENWPNAWRALCGMILFSPIEIQAATILPSSEGDKCLIHNTFRRPGEI